MIVEKNRSYFSRPPAAGLLAAILTFALYLPAAQNGFVNWDDDHYIYENEGIRTLDGQALFRTFTEPYFSNWHPLTSLTYLVEYRLWGDNPRGYHLVNALMHAVNTFLVFLLFHGMLQLRRRQTPEEGVQFFIEERRAIVGAFVGALLFGIHPLHVESVAWISERKDVLCGFFCLLSLLAYLRFARTTGNGRRRDYGLALLFFALALMSKPMAISLPLVLVVLDMGCFRRVSKTDRRRLFRIFVVEKAPFYLLSLFSAWITLLAQAGAIAPGEIVALPTRILVAARALIFYLAKMIAPTGLAPIYPYPPNPTVVSLEFGGSVLLVVGITVSVFSIWRRTRLYATAWMIYVVTLLPVIGIVQVGSQAAADRYTYLPALAPFFLLAVGVGGIYPRLKAARFKALAVVFLFGGIGVLAATSLAQIAVWKNSESLWTHQIALYPNRSAVARFNRANAAVEKGELRNALRDFDAAIAIQDNYAEAYYNRGNTWESLGNVNRAILDYDSAIQLKPDHADAFANRGRAKHLRGDLSGAISDYTRTLAIDADDADTLFNRALAWEQAGNPRRALEDLMAAIQLAPAEAKNYYGLGMLYRRRGDATRAETYLRKAAELGYGKAGK